MRPRALAPRRTGARAAAAILTLVGSLLIPAAIVPASAQVATETDVSALARNVELIGRSDLGGRTNNAGIWGHRSFAYIGSASTPAGATPCPGTGVAIVDLADPTNPALIRTLAERPGTAAEDVQVLTVFSETFTGDLLAAGLQPCGPGGVGGLSLWDVTDPRAPAELSLVETGPGSSGVSDLSVFRRGQQTLALLVVPSSEGIDPTGPGELRIVDISDPRAPVHLADWDVSRQLGAGGLDGRDQDPPIRAHSVLASADGQRAYIASRDAGVVILDISDPGSPRYVGRTTFGVGDEGSAHAVAVAKGGRVLIQADEDGWVRIGAIEVEGTSFDGLMDAAFGVFRSLLPAEDLVAPAAYVGRGCPAGQAGEGSATPADLYLTDPRGNVAIVDRGGCSLVDKAVRAQAAGAVALVVVNDAPTPFSPDADARVIRIPVATIGTEAGAQLKEALAAGLAPRLRFTTRDARHDDWGFLRFWDISNPANPVQLATFATEYIRTDPQGGPPDGSRYTAHEPVVLGDRLYVAWYADGLRILDVADPTRPREVGYFIPTSESPAQEDDSASSTAGDGWTWGVYPRGDLILVSDQRLGLFVLRDRTR
ncbi:MAG: hypothetical protein M3O34_11860 [Chloroflexota bacterium]|nr:hypothetical protein [Chloroflexota bacterium]